jgi:nitrous oxidase accessory protein
MKRKWLAVGIILLFVGTCIIPAIAQNTEKPQLTLKGNWLYVGGSGPGNYTRIQDAIDNASDGDTVYVYPGLYVELLVINRSIDLLGVDKNSTIIDGNDTHLGSAITINKDNVSVTNFTIQNSNSDGIKIYTSDNTISDNIITRNGAGIYLFSHIKNNVFHDNQISHSHPGLELHGGQKTKVTHNFFQDCSLGIELMGSDNTSISWNIFENATNIELYDVTNSTIENNLLISSGTILLRIAKNMEIKNNTFIDSKGIEISGNINHWSTHIIENNTMNDKQIYYYRHTSGVIVPSDTGEIILVNCTDFIIEHIIFSKGGGIQLGYSSSNTICWNTIDGASNGIHLHTSSYNNISYNTITNCSDGIKITDDSIENEISRNMIFHNSDDGIYLSHDASDNWIYQNRIENNNYHGIYIAGKSTLCSENHITNNSYGVSLWYTSNTTISRNNFVHNIIHVSFEADYTTSHSNTWDSNFYSPEIPRFLKIIFGNVRTRFYIMVGPMHDQWKEYFYRPGINVDWHPAQEPYDIPDMS